MVLSNVALCGLALINVGGLVGVLPELPAKVFTGAVLVIGAAALALALWVRADWSLRTYGLSLAAHWAKATKRNESANSFTSDIPEMREFFEDLGAIANERQRAEREHQAQLLELRARYREMEQERRHLEATASDALATAEARMSFLAQMSHEIRTPLNGVLGMTELAMDLEQSSAMEEHLNTIHASARGLADIVNDILDLSKIEAGHVTLEEETFNLERMLADLLPSLAVLAEQRDLELGAEVSPDVPRHMRGDAMRLRQVLHNLLGNAVKFTPAGFVRLWVDAPLIEGKRWLRFEVRDSGIGMTAEQLSRAFDPFQQADSSITRRFGGTGLGLSICQRLAELMRGRLDATSEVGKGSIFSLCFPVATAAQSIEAVSRDERVLVIDEVEEAGRLLVQKLQRAGAQAEWSPKCPRQIDDFVDYVFANAKTIRDDLQAQEILAGRRGRKSLIVIERSLLPSRTSGASGRYLKTPIFTGRLERILSAEVTQPKIRLEEIVQPARSLNILVAEDNLVNQTLIRRLLEKCGHHVTIVSNGEQAYRHAMDNRPDLVLMDVEMPVLDGIQATRRIRDAGGTGFQIWALTAHATVEHRRMCLESGMDGWLTKPINRQDLEKALSTVAAHCSTVEGVEFASSDLTVVSTLQMPEPLVSNG